jgi:zinc/manganese transport system permease protein
VFTVIRGQSFAGEALGDVGAAGGSSAYLAGVASLWGFMAVAVAAAGVSWTFARRHHGAPARAHVKS